VDLNGKERCWGGLNIVYCGDFLQLPPTRSTPLCTLPRRLMDLGPVAVARHACSTELSVSIPERPALKSQVCKLGAAQFARDHGQPILWAQADDRVTSSCGLLEDAHLLFVVCLCS